MSIAVLSPAQTRAVETRSRAVVVSAGAGSGKTEVIARRIERLLKESEDEGYRILALTYTVKAADELRQRLAARLGDVDRRVDSDTIHGLAYALLRQYGTRIGLPPEPEVLTRDADRVDLLNSWLLQSSQEWPSDPRETLTQIDLARAKCLSAPLLEEWRRALAARNALDYPAMLERATEMADGPWFRRHVERLYGHVVVDEAQNLTPAQYRFLRQLIGPPGETEVCAALFGDERQSIIGFAGADSALMSLFEQEYGAERIEFRWNYRSARRIVSVGEAVTRALGRPVESANVEYPAEGSVEVRSFSSELDEAQGVADWIHSLLSDGLPSSAVATGESTKVAAEEVAVLSRAAASLRPIGEALSKREISFATGSTPEDWVASLPAALVIDLVAYYSAPGHISTRRRLAAACLGQPDAQWESLISLLRQASSDSIRAMAPLANQANLDDFMATVLSLEIDDFDWCADVRQIADAWTDFADRVRSHERSFGNFRQHLMRCQREDALDPGVRLLTIHKAQGREFRAVALIACNDGQLPDFRARGESQLHSELRAFYVAVSRAARVLLLTRARSRNTRFGPRKTEPSRFLKLLGAVPED